MAKIINLSEVISQRKNATKKRSVSKEKIDSTSKSLSILKITLSDWGGNVKGNPYRVISIPTDKTLDKFAEAILDSFDFELDHMYGFYDNLKNWTRSNESYTMDDEIGNPTGFVTGTSVGEVFEKPKKKMLFLFDYGDEWRFVVELLEVKSHEGKTKLPTEVIESKGEAPPQYPDFEA